MNDGFSTGDEGTQGSGLFNYLPTILWQRRWLIILPLLLLTAAGIAAAYLLPAVYRSSATLLVESQELPSDIVEIRETSVIDQRIAKIRAQVLSRGDLIELIQQHNLYAEERKSKPLSTIVQKMRDATSIEAVSANLGQGTNRTETIAFSLAFDYHEPLAAQLVVQEHVRRFLDLDSSQMTERAQNTVNFLTGQAAGLQRQIAQIEGQINSIKAQNGLVLGGANSITMLNAGSYDAQIAALQRDNALLARQAAATAKDPAVAAAEAQLAAARAVYSENHPDVRLARQRLEEAKRLATPPEQRDLAILTQIEGNNAQIAALERARSSDVAQVAAARSAQARAPLLMERIAQLENRAEGLRSQHKEIANKLLTAGTAVRMEEEQKGERLSLIEAPAVPDRPAWPNRPLLMLGGLAAGLLAGIVLALAVELIRRPIRGAAEVEHLTGVPPLGVVPTLSIRGGRQLSTPWGRRLTPWRRAA